MNTRATTSLHRHFVPAQKFHLILPLSSATSSSPLSSYNHNRNNEAGLPSTFPQCIVDHQSAADAKRQWQSRRRHRNGRCQYDPRRAPPDQSARDCRRNFICQWYVSDQLCSVFVRLLQVLIEKHIHHMFRCTCMSCFPSDPPPSQFPPTMLHPNSLSQPTNTTTP